MNKNTVLAFVLILGTVYFFNSPIYYEKVLKKPFPKKNTAEINKNVTAPEKTDIGLVANKNSAGKEAIPVFDTIGQNSLIASGETISTGIPFDTIIVETDVLICAIQELGGVIVSLKMKNFNYNALSKSKDKDSLIELVPEGSFGASLTIDSKNYDKEIFKHVDSSFKSVVVDSDKKSVAFSCFGTDGQTVTKTFTFAKEGYLIDYDVESPFVAGRKVQIGWLSGIRESEKGGKFKAQSSRYTIKKAHTFDGKEVQHIARKKEGIEESTGLFWWAGVSSKYFLVALIPQDRRDADLAIDAFGAGKGKNRKYDYRLSFSRIADNSRESYRIFAGPMKMADLKSANVNLKKVLYGGWRWFARADLWFPALCEVVLYALFFLQGIVKDYGVAIVLLTVIVKLVTFPMTQSSTKSMSRMKDIQPKVNNIKNKYKGNAQKMNEEIMALYKKEGINPMNPGCLPMFLQMPILFSLFIVLRKAIELRGSGTILLPWIKDLSQAEALPVLTPLFQKMVPAGFPMYGNTVGLMPVVMAVLTYFQNKATIKDPNQKAMIYIMPVFMLVLFNAFPSGLVLYWTVSSGLGLVQQHMANRKNQETKVKK